MLSMTGFGKAETLLENHNQLSIEISSVNRKQFELRLNLAPEISSFEVLFRKKLGETVSRGSISVHAALKKANRSNSAGDMQINKAWLKELISVSASIRKECGQDGSVDVEKLISAPGVISFETAEIAPEVLEKAVRETLDKACENYQAMRITEGEALKVELETRLAGLEKLLSQIEPEVADYPERIKAKLLNRLNEEKIPVPAGDELLMKEVLFYADRADVTEEITRLKSHFLQFKKFFNSSIPSGRSMDFLIQESFREITTLGNKTGSSGISPLIVSFKSELEKMREQIQNVE